MKVISKSEIDPLYYEFQEEAERLYIEKVTPLVDRIKISNASINDRLRMIYDYLVNNCIIDYNYMKKASKHPDGLYAEGIRYSYGKITDQFGILLSTNKYGPVICGKGVCAGFQEAFVDIARRCDIKVSEIHGNHLGWGHGWVGTYDKGEIKYIDVYQGIENKRASKNIYEWFMTSKEKLLSSGYKDFEEDEKKALMKLKPKITFKRPKPGFRVISIDDANKELDAESEPRIRFKK